MSKRKNLKEQTRLSFQLGGNVVPGSNLFGGPITNPSLTPRPGGTIGSVARNPGVAQNLIGPLGTPMGSVGTFGYTPPPAQVGTQVVVYGPDGTAYANPAAAIAAGVNNYTMTPPTAPTGKAAAPVQAASAQYQLQGTQFTGSPQSTNLPTFGQVIGTNPGQYDELRRYVNDAGIVRLIPFKNGEPIYPIPEGFKFEPEDTTQVTDPTTTPTTTIGQQDGGGGDDGFSSGVQSQIGGTTGLTGIRDAISGVTGYFSGERAKARDFKGTTLSSITSQRGFAGAANNIPGVQDALGVYGSRPANMSAALSVLMGNPLGAAFSVRGRDTGVGMFGQEAPAGFGSFSTAQLNDYVSGKMSPIEMQATGIAAMNKEQARARAEVQAAIGTEITGVLGYQPGDISPLSGLPMNQKGRVVNFRGTSTGVSAEFASMTDWIDALETAAKSNHYGGLKSKAEVNQMSPKAKARYEDWATLNNENPNGVGLTAKETAQRDDPDDTCLLYTSPSPRDS